MPQTCPGSNILGSRLFHALYYEEHVYILKYDSNHWTRCVAKTLLAHVRVSGCETKVVRVRLVCAAKYLTCGVLPFRSKNEPPSCIVLCREKAYAKN